MSELLAFEVQPAAYELACPKRPSQRQLHQGIEIDIAQLLPIFVAFSSDKPVSDSLRCWSLAVKLAVKLAAGQQVIPTAVDSDARWLALLTRKADRDQFYALALAMPTSSRAIPTRSSGVVRLNTREHVLRSFTNHVIDTLYRQNAHPGTARGWALEFAEALRGPYATFSPSSARHQLIPEQLRTWSAGTDVAGLVIGLHLGLPKGKSTRFPLELNVLAAQDPSCRAPIATAWQAGSSLTLGGHVIHHPAYTALRGLARAARIYPLLKRCLSGPTPSSTQLTSTEAWNLLSNLQNDLIDAGFDVIVPDAFHEAGTHRLQAQMRLARLDSDNTVSMGRIGYQWEVVLGSTLIDGADFAKLVAGKQPIVRYQGDWVLLDPVDIAKLPKDMKETGTLPAAEALRAALTGEHNGVRVVTDESLGSFLDSLRKPPVIRPPITLHGTLRAYQQRGFSWLVTLGGLGLGACLADDMGLGKTIQFIAYLLYRRPSAKAPSLVVCPTSVLGNWTHELHRFAPSLRVKRYHGLGRNVTTLDQADVVLTTYGLLVRDIDELSTISWDVIALDEAQAIKNPDSQRARAARQLTSRHRVALSGTPVENRLEELWSLMEFLVPGLLGTRNRFRTQVAIPVERFNDEVLAERLKQGVAPFLLRRLKTDPTIISDLPEKIERKEYVSLTPLQAKLYKQVVEQAMERIVGAESVARRGHVLAMLTALKQVCNHPAQYLGQPTMALDGLSGKLERCDDLMASILALDEQVLVFTQYKVMGRLLQKHFEKHTMQAIPFLHGGVSADGREEMVRRFQEDPNASPVLIISLRAGGTGLNLTKATHVIHYDRWWNPAVEDQATDRAYRIGQIYNVHVHKMVSQGTLEERIDALLEEKRALAGQVVGSGERWITELDDNDLLKLVTLGEDAVWDDEA